MPTSPPINLHRCVSSSLPTQPNCSPSSACPSLGASLPIEVRSLSSSDHMLDAKRPAHIPSSKLPDRSTQNSRGYPASKRKSGTNHSTPDAKPTTTTTWQIIHVAIGNLSILIVVDALKVMMMMSIDAQCTSCPPIRPSLVDPRNAAVDPRQSLVVSRPFVLRR
jgi:hypothetical protein